MAELKSDRMEMDVSVFSSPTRLMPPKGLNFILPPPNLKAMNLYIKRLFSSRLMCRSA